MNPINFQVSDTGKELNDEIHRLIANRIDNMMSEMERKIEKYYQWHDAKQYLIPLDQPVLVYLVDGSFAIATRQAACVVIGHNVPIADVILLWIELPELPTGVQNL